MKTFDELAELDQKRVTFFAAKLNLQPGAEWYTTCVSVLGGPGNSLELSDLFWTELFREVENMHNMDTWKASLRPALYGDAEGMVDYKEWVKALQEAANIAGVSFTDVLDAYYE